jgi:hypothetical protein
MTGPTRGKAVLYSVALFAAGVVCGAMILPKTPPSQQSLKVGRSGEIITNIQTKLAARLDLTPAQLEKFAPLIKQAGEQVEASHQNCLKEICAASDSLHAQISPELTLEQRQKLSVLEEERRKLMLDKYNFPPTNR